MHSLSVIRYHSRFVVRDVGNLVRKLFRVLKVVWPVVLVRLDALNDIIDWVGFGGVLVIALTRPRSDIARIGIIEPHAMMFSYLFLQGLLYEYFSYYRTRLSAES